MWTGSEGLTQVLDSSAYDRAWLGSLIYNGVTRVADLPLVGPSFRWDSGAQVAGSGSCQIVSTDPFGRSIVPRQIGDLFSPFGAELQVDVLIRQGDFSERVPMGRFVLDAVPTTREYSIEGPAGGEPIVVESRIELSLKDYMLRVQRDRFAFPTAPSSTSMWTEAFDLTGLATLRNVQDVPVPRSVTYDEDRLKALDDLFAVADAWPHLTRTGQLTARPKQWPAPVSKFRGVVSAPRVMESDKVYNRVVVEGKSPAGVVIRAIAEVTEGFLRVRNTDGSRSPFGVATYRYQSGFLTTYPQCLATAQSMLSRVSRLRSVRRTIVEPFMPLRDVGDVVLLEAEGELARILSVTHNATTTTCEVEVAE